VDFGTSIVEPSGFAATVGVVMYETHVRGGEVNYCTPRVAYLTGNPYMQMNEE
jgi:hypothetical protein